MTENERGLLSLNYVEFIPLIIEAIKEQKLIIDSLKTVIQDIDCKSTNLLKSKPSTYKKDADVENPVQNTLYQNKPNPFTESTEIEYYIEENIQSSNVYIYDMNGMQLKGFEIEQKGYGSITIKGSDLKAGMYMYTLITDGQIVDTKQMILTK